jgi:outer membrane protein OmpA-like peptidoglycan-associated protein
MSRNLIIIIGIILLLLLIIFCLLCHTKGIEDDIRTRCETAFAEAGIPDSLITVDGRDVLLHGYVQDQALSDKAGAVLSGIDGVRTVRNELKLAATMPPSADAVEELISAVSMQKEIDRLTSKTPLEFEFNSDRLRTPVKGLLSGISEILSSGPDIHVQLEGHTDSKGTVEYNQLLSEERASAVKRELVVNGIASDRIETKGYSELRPIADNSTEAGRQKNRRVEIYTKEGK